jgi:hypothetical protein
MGSDGSSGDETDALGGLAPPRTLAAERLGRSGAMLPGRTIGQSFNKALSLGALLGGGIGAGSGLVLGLLFAGDLGAGINLMMALPAALPAALIGMFVGLVCACGAAAAVLLAVWFGATGRWAKILAAVIGAILSVLAIAGIVEGNGYPILTNGLAPWVTPVFLALLAGAAGGLSISVLDSDSRRTAAMRAAPRRLPPPIPQRSNRDSADAAETITGRREGTHVPEPTASIAEHVEPARSLDRARQLRSVGVVLGVLGLVSIPWMLLAMGSAFRGFGGSWSDLAVAWFGAQFFVAAAIPASALGFAVASSVVGRRARQHGASDADLIPTPGGVAVLTGCVLAVTLLCGVALFTELSRAGDAYAEQQSWQSPVNPPDSLDEEGAPVGVSPEIERDVPLTQLSASEVTAGMQTLLDVAVSAAGPSAVWKVSNGDGTYRELGGATTEVAPAVTSEVCSAGAAAGLSDVFPDVNFTTGVITDTSTDEHDREVTASNVAAAKRILAAWEALGYRRDSGLGGNIDLGGAVDQPAMSLHIRYSFGLVTLVRVSQCLPEG